MPRSRRVVLALFTRSDTTGTATADGFHSAPGDFGGGASPCRPSIPMRSATGESVFQPTVNSCGYSPNVVTTGESVLQPTVKLQVLLNAIATAGAGLRADRHAGRGAADRPAEHDRQPETVYAPTLGQQIVPDGIGTAAQVFSPSVAVVTPQTIQAAIDRDRRTGVRTRVRRARDPGVSPDAIPCRGARLRAISGIRATPAAARASFALRPSGAPLSGVWLRSGAPGVLGVLRVARVRHHCAWVPRSMPTLSEYRRLVAAESGPYIGPEPY